MPPSQHALSAQKDPLVLAGAPFVEAVATLGEASQVGDLLYLVLGRPANEGATRRLGLG